jgi:hypothetical protein
MILLSTQFSAASSYILPLMSKYSCHSKAGASYLNKRCDGGEPLRFFINCYCEALLLV